jgi:hypothetical protein
MFSSQHIHVHAWAVAFQILSGTTRIFVDDAHLI